MLLSTLGYYSLFRVCLDFTFEEGIHYNTPISVFRVLLILGFLAMIALDANYLGIQDRLKISQLKWPVRILMLIVLNVFLFGFIVFLISQILEKVFA